MRKIRILSAVLIFSLAPVGPCFAEGTHSGRAFEESVQAGSHAFKGSGHATLASGQLVSATAVVPFAIVGSVGVVGSVGTEIVRGMMDAETTPAGTPLPITDETITAGPPPNVVLQTNTDARR